jgi:hypothetical protein
MKRHGMRLTVMLLVLIFGMSADSASGAEVFCSVEGYVPGWADNLARKVGPGDSLKGKCIDADLRGPIVNGDYKKVEKLIEDSWPRLATISLESEGGSVREALQIGRILRKFLVTTDVPANRCMVDVSGALVPSGLSVPPNPDVDSCVCASACALVWFGGVERMGTVGLHRPKITDPDFANLPPAEAMTVYRKILADIETYLTEMEVPHALVDKIAETGSSDIDWITARDSHAERPGWEQS